MNPLRGITSVALAAMLLVAPATTFADHSRSWRSSPTILDVLTRVDGTQALVAAVLVVDEAEVLDFSIAELLDDKRAEIILFAPSNPAFESLLDLDPGTLDGLSVEEIQEALPDLLPSGVGPEEVAAILLKHAALPKRANRYTGSERSLLKQGSVEVADGSMFPVSVGSAGTRINYESSIAEADFFARNGVVHFVDTVIVDDLL